MYLNEESCGYIRQAANQIEGLTCALIAFIENAGCDLETYHYEAFNKFSNEIRDMEISVSKEIKNEFAEIRKSIEESAIKIRASESFISRLRAQLADTESAFSRLVIHSENIREFHSDTSNPYVPHAKQEVYKAFSGYERFLDQYRIGRPQKDDPICTLMYSFCCTVNALYERLFSEYDTLLQGFGDDVDEKRNCLSDSTLIKRSKGNSEIAKAATGVVKTAAFAALGIKKKNVFDVVESGIGLVAAVSKTLDDLDELKYAKPKKSVARNVIRGIAVYHDAVELVGGLTALPKAFGAGLEVSTLTKLALAAPVAMGKSKELGEWSSSGKLDVVNSALGVLESGAGFVGSIVTGAGALAVIRSIPDLGSNCLGLVEKTAKYVHEISEKAPQKAAGKHKILQKLGAQLKAYNKDVDEYKIAKMKKLMAVKKPKAPPFIVAKNVFDTLKKGMDLYEEGVSSFETVK